MGQLHQASLPQDGCKSCRPGGNCSQLVLTSVHFHYAYGFDIQFGGWTTCSTVSTIYTWKKLGITFTLSCLDAGFFIRDSLWELKGWRISYLGEQILGFRGGCYQQENLICLFSSLETRTLVWGWLGGWGFHLLLLLLANRCINEKLKIRLLSACNNLSLVLTGCNLR